MSQVNTNGVLSFKQPFLEATPKPFPNSSIPLIALYWENSETTARGLIHYRNTTNPTLLRRTQSQLQDVFPSARSFLPSYVFVVTWDNLQRLAIAGSNDEVFRKDL